MRLSCTKWIPLVKNDCSIPELFCLEFIEIVDLNDHQFRICVTFSSWVPKLQPNVEQNVENDKGVANEEIGPRVQYKPCTRQTPSTALFHREAAL
jgi:hypothetical protein